MWASTSGPGGRKGKDKEQGLSQRHLPTFKPLSQKLHPTTPTSASVARLAPLTAKEAGNKRSIFSCP